MAKWSPAEAQVFVRSCEGFAIHTGLCAWGLRREQIGGSQTLIVVSDHQRCWLLEPQGERGDVLHCRSLTGEDAIGALIGMSQTVVRAACAD